MLAIISPAKRLDLKSIPTVTDCSIPEDLDRSEQLIVKLRKTSGKKISELMGISKELVDLNVGRYASWSAEMTSQNSRQAIFTFDGEVYRGLDVPNLTGKNLKFAQDHLRILSGLHGVLRPLDLIKPYRLEMGTKLPVRRKKNLYEFWSATITSRLNEDLEKSGSRILVNLASAEYFKAINFKKLNAQVIEPVFMDLKNGQYKVLFTYAKQARGMMTKYIIENQCVDSEELKGFASGGYTFSESMSERHRWVFTR